MKPILVGLLLAGSMTAFAGAGLAQDETTARPAKVTTVALADTALQWRYSAIVFPSREVELSFRVSGQVIDLPVRAATSVKEGDVIARIDPRDFEANVAQLISQRDQAEAQLDALRAGARAEEIAALEAAVAASQAQLDQARDQLQRTRQLVERGVATTAQLEQEEANLRVAEANLRAQREQLAIGQSGGRPEEIAAAEAALRGLNTQIDTARNNLNDATLRAPFTGIVARRDIQNFSNIQAGQSVVLLQTLSTVDLVFDVPGSDVVALGRDEEITAKATFTDLPGQSFDAELVEFSTQADAATQTYRGRVAVQVPEGVIVLPGMVGHIHVSSSQPESTAVAVPLTALAANPDGTSFVWLVDAATNTVSPRKIELGEASGDSIKVLSGLQEGDVVVTAGVSKLQDGMTIRPITKIGG